MTLLKSDVVSFFLLKSDIVAWRKYGLVTSQVDDKNKPVEVLGLSDIPLNDYLKEFPRLC